MEIQDLNEDSTIHNSSPIVWHDDFIHAGRKICTSVRQFQEDVFIITIIVDDGFFDKFVILCARSTFDAAFAQMGIDIDRALNHF